MSLRGKETTEAISQGIDISEIATLPSVARNDRKGITTQSLEGGGVSWFLVVKFPANRHGLRATFHPIKNLDIL
jgi:hypothetical protein